MERSHEEWRFGEATAGDWPAIAAHLTAAGLTLAGAEEHLRGFLLASAGDELAGTAALERYGESALLRSVAVSAAWAGTGLGQELVRRLLDQAYTESVRTVLLLTNTAEQFFPRFGFQPIAREEAPTAVTASAEFRGACPCSCITMRLDLTHPAVLVRPVSEADLPAVAAIYNQGIEDRATLETEPRTVAERHDWLARRSLRHPVVVAVQQGEVRGWASLNPFSHREAYRWVADLSVYVARADRRRGTGTALIMGLVDRARRLDYHKLVLTTFPTATAAVNLYAKVGFRHVGDLQEQGLLDGQWVDTRIMERIL